MAIFMEYFVTQSQKRFRSSLETKDKYEGYVQKGNISEKLKPPFG